MPLDYENLTQYNTPLSCPECGQRIFQTDAQPTTPSALVEAECTSCGHALTEGEIDAQTLGMSPEDFSKAIS